MFGKHYFGCGVLAFFRSVSGEATLLWMIEHTVFAFDSYVKNNEFVTVVRREFRRHFNIHRNQSVPTHKTIVRWVNALRTQGTLLDRGLVGAPRRVRTPENI